MSKRNSQLKTNLIRGTGFKVLSQLCVILNVFITTRLLGIDQFGIWLVISSVVNWISVGDFGMGNVIKSRVAHLLEINDTCSAREVISTTYVYSTLSATVLAVLILPATLLVDWQGLLNTSMSGQDLIRVAMTCFLLFCIRLVTQLITAIASASHRNWVAELSNTAVQIATFIIGCVLLFFEQRSLLVYAFSISMVPICVHVALSAVMFRGSLYSLRPGLSMYRPARRREILAPGLMFFLIQICGLIIFSTDNVIVSHLFGPSEVVTYSSTLKCFGMITLIFGMIQAPLWPSYASAIATDDMNWINASVFKMTQLWLATAAATIAFLPLSPFIIQAWIGTKPPLQLCVACSVFVLTSSFGSIFVAVINASGRIRLQAIISLIAAVINIPLSIFLAKWMGSTGVIVATTVCLSYGPTIAVMHYSRIVNHQTDGIWSR